MEPQKLCYPGQVKHTVSTQATMACHSAPFTVYPLAISRSEFLERPGHRRGLKGTFSHPKPGVDIKGLPS